jgi:hypothetical protein
MVKAEDSYWVLLTYFDCCKIPLICNGIDLIDSGVINKSYFDFSNDFMLSVLREYAHFNSNECFKISNYG